MNRTVRSVALIACVTCLAAPTYSREYGQYDAAKIVSISQSASGQPSATVDFSRLDRILDDLSAHAESYSPQFDSPDDARRAQTDVRVLGGQLDVLVQGPTPNVQILMRAAVLNSIAHNMDIPGTGERAMAEFTALMKMVPESANANYLFGKFLLNTGQAAAAVPVLEKAKTLGAINTDYTLGLAYLLLGQKERALENLEQYAKRVPGDPNAAKIIDAARNGNVTLKRGPPPGAEH